jgi:hypothetical protein
MFAVPIFVMVNRKVVDSQDDCGNNWTEDYRGEVLFSNSFSYRYWGLCIIVRASFPPCCLFVITYYTVSTVQVPVQYYILGLYLLFKKLKKFRHVR